MTTTKNKTVKYAQFLSGPMQRVSLKKIAQDLVRRAVEENYMPSGYELWQSYPIENNQQMQTIKRMAKTLAFEDFNKMWGYHPQTNTYRVCPDGSKQIAHEMLEYAFKHFGNSGRNTSVLLDASRAQGFTSKAVHGKARRKLGNVLNSIDGLADDLGLLIQD